MSRTTAQHSVAALGSVTAHSTMTTLEKGKLRYNIIKYFAPVTVVGTVPLVVVVNTALPVKTLTG